MQHKQAVMGAMVHRRAKWAGWFVLTVVAVAACGDTEAYPVPEGQLPGIAPADELPFESIDESQRVFPVSSMGHEARSGRPLFEEGVADWSSAATPLTYNNENIGDAMAIDGINAIVTNLEGTGTAYAFARGRDNVWTWLHQLNHPGDIEPEDEFGASVDIAGDLAVLGAPSYGDGGGACVFLRTDEAWQGPVMVAAPSSLNADAQFGRAVAVMAEPPSMLVGASAANLDGSTAAGAAYLYAYNNDSWGLQHIFSAASPQTDGELGRAVDLGPGRVVVGEPGGEDSQGRVHVFDWLEDEWVAAPVITPVNGENDDKFGQTLALEGDLMLIGAPKRNKVDQEGEGGAYVYRHLNGAWSAIQYLESPLGDSPSNRGFGAQVALSNGRAAVYSSGEKHVYMYRWDPVLDSFVEDGQTAPAMHSFPQAVALDGQQLFARHSNTEIYVYQSLFEQGEKCNLGAECASGFCSDGYCCDAACDGSCDRCDMEGAAGTCTVAEAGYAGEPACAAVLCDGEQVACPDSCTDSFSCVEGACNDATGQCEYCIDDNTAWVNGGEVSCGAYRCGSSGCLGACDTFDDCAVGYVCDGYRNLCIDPAARDDEKGGCNAGGSGSLPRSGWWLLLCVPLLWRRRRAESSKTCVVTQLAEPPASL